MSKNPLAKNIPEHSTVADVNAESNDLGFKVEILDRKSNAPAVVIDKPDDKHHFIPEGEYMMIAWYRKIERTTYDRDRFGRIIEKAPHHEIRFIPYGCKDPNEYYTVEIPCTPKEDSKDEWKFRNNINNRSGGDMAYKFNFAGYNFNDVTISNICAYTRRYPVKIRSEHTEYYAADGTVTRSYYPKVRLWLPEDKMTDEEVAWDTK